MAARIGADRRSRERTAEDERRAGDPEWPALSEPARFALALQRTAGNQAVSAMLQRKLKFAPSKQWLPKGKGALPPVPQDFVDRYETWVVQKVRARAVALRDDDVTANREFANATDFYSPLFDGIIQATAGNVPLSNRDAWSTLAKAVKQSAPVTEVPWASLDRTRDDLLQDLLKCRVQRSDNPRTTACHGNNHNKLPKKITVPGGIALDQLAPHQQPPHTPYFEFLIEKKKSSTGIERAILDKDSGFVYICQHYTEGSFAWLSGAPPDLVKNWDDKVVEYWSEIGYEPAQ